MSDLIGLSNTVEALRDPNRWLKWFNEVGVGVGQVSPIWTAARNLGLAVAGKEPLNETAAQILRKLLEPPLQKAWSQLLPSLESIPGPEGVTLSPRIFFSDPEKCHPTDPEPFLVFGFFQFLVTSPGNASLRVCSVCEKFFVDRSRAQQGKFCSSTCRGRGFRKKG